MSDPLDSAYKEFIAECEEHIEELYRNIDELESAVSGGKRIDPDVLNAMFRAAHSLKGVSGMFGFETLSKLSHDLENILDELRLGKRQATQTFIGHLYDAVDALRKILAAGKEDALSDEVRREAVNIIDQLMKTREEESPKGIEESGYDVPERIVSVMTEYEEHRLRENMRMGMNLYLLKAVFDLEDFDERLNLLNERIKQDGGEVISTLPSADEVEPGKIKFELLVGTESALEEVKKKLSDFKIEIEELKKKAEVPPAPAPPVEEKPPPPPTETPVHTTQFLRVEIYRLDEIMNVVGELFLARTAVGRLLERWKREGKDTEDILELERIERSMERNLNDLRERIMEIRMIPVKSLFDRVTRAVKKIAREMKKDIVIEYSGEETKLDKFIIEELMDPLMHIIRNSIDHGLESPEERMLAGKPETGRISLLAYQKGNHVVIEVEDDGRGIDVEKIRAKAVEKGLIGRGEVISEEELLNLIFMPGFSTKDEVSMISGRGVGLDVVADKIKGLRGIVEVKTKKGEMTRFVLTLPMTLAIIQALLIKIGEREFGIPITAVHETIEYESSILRAVEGREVVLLRDETIPILNLEQMFSFSTDGYEPRFLIITGMGDRKVGIPVTDLIGRSDVVIKSLGGVFKNLKGIAGAADLGEDRIVLILDVTSLLEEVVRV